MEYKLYLKMLKKVISSLQTDLNQHHFTSRYNYARLFQFRLRQVEVYVPLQLKRHYAKHIHICEKLLLKFSYSSYESYLIVYVKNVIQNVNFFCEIHSVCK